MSSANEAQLEQSKLTQCLADLRAVESWLTLKLSTFDAERDQCVAGGSAKYEFIGYYDARCNFIESCIADAQKDIKIVEQMCGQT